MGTRTNYSNFINMGLPFIAGVALIGTYISQIKDLWTNDIEKRTRAIENITYGFIVYSAINGFQEINWKMSVLLKTLDKAIITDANFALCFSAIICVSMSPALDAFAILYFTYAFYLIFEFMKPIIQGGIMSRFYLFESMIDIIIIFIIISTGILSLSEETVTDKLKVKI